MGWNIRPNPFSKEQGIEAGPFPKGLKQMTGMWHQMMPDIEVERLQTIRMGNKVAVISELSATMRDVPQGLDEYPMFPGIPASQLKGKNFTTLCLAVHVLDDKEHHHDEFEHQHERIRRSWAIEDWTEAADQMLNDRRPAKFDHPWHKRGQNLTSVPIAIHRFYDQILSAPAKAAQNFTLLNETVKEDWTVRPNPVDIVGGKGPGVVGLQRIMQLFGEIIPDLKFERKEMFTALEMARSNKLITLKIGPQLFTKCSTTDQLLTLDLRETLLISKCSIFIFIMILIMF